VQRVDERPCDICRATNLVTSLVGHYVSTPARCRRDPVPDGITERFSRIGQILQPRSQFESSTCADRARSLSSSCPDQGSEKFLPSAAKGTVVVGAANLRCYLRFNCDARLVNKRAASTAHRRSGKWRYYADLPAGWILEREKGTGRTREGKRNNRARFSGKVTVVACKPGEIFTGLTGACAGGSANIGAHTCACTGVSPAGFANSIPRHTVNIRIYV